MYWDLEFVDKNSVITKQGEKVLPDYELFAMCFAVIALGTDFREEADVEVITELKKKIRQRVKGE